MSGRRSVGGQVIVCYGPDACEAGHEPPDPDCWKCAKAFWGWALNDHEAEAEFMAKGSEGGSGAHESGKSSDGKGKDGYTGKHEADAKDSGKDGKK